MTDGTQPIETGNVPASAVGGQPLGREAVGLPGRPSGLISSADVRPGEAKDKPVLPGKILLLSKEMEMDRKKDKVGRKPEMTMRQNQKVQMLLNKKLPNKLGRD
jgi:hypothetical protein